jgi:hypothetical protein
LNHVLKDVGVAYGPCPVPVSAEVLKKWKADAVVKVSAKCSKVPEKKGAEPVKVSRARASGGPKWPSGADILPVKSMKLSKGTAPHAIASTVVRCIMPEAHGSENLLNAWVLKLVGKA